MQGLSDQELVQAMGFDAAIKAGARADDVAKPEEPAAPALQAPTVLNVAQEMAMFPVRIWEAERAQALSARNCAAALVKMADAFVALGIESWNKTAPTDSPAAAADITACLALVAKCLDAAKVADALGDRPIAQNATAMLQGPKLGQA